jgi:hypothetical protein
VGFRLIGVLLVIVLGESLGLPFQFLDFTIEYQLDNQAESIKNQCDDD